MTDKHERRTPSDAEERSGRLVVLEGGRVGQKILLHGDELIVGRAHECDIRFDDGQLSRRHASIRKLGPLIYEVRDLGSSNGTFVNGAPATDPVLVQVDDRIRFGTSLVVQLTLHDPVEEQILQRQRLETLGRLVSGVAHDFNNMLGAVQSNLEYLEGLPPNATVGSVDTAECINDIRRASSRAAQLSRRLVSYARGERRSGLIDVSAICEEVAQVAERTFDRTISVRTEIEAQLIAAGDDLELHQVLMNLCLNARDAMPGGGTLTIRASREGTSSLRVEVGDTGVGMGATTKARIFEAFFSTKKGSGFGLGLATAYEIVKTLGGSITVDSTLDVGTTFVVTLPASAARTRWHTVSTSRDRVDDVFTDSRAGHILVVDDEDMVRRSTRRILALAGHEVSEATCGAEALTTYAHGHPRPDVVLLDLSMPDGSGDEVLARLLEIDPDACIVIVTGHQDPTREQSLRDSGAHGIVHKPWEPGELLELVEALLSDDVTSDRPTRA